MDSIYKNYFQNSLYPTLVLKPEDGAYTVKDANRAFLNLMEINIEAIKDKDFLDTFLSYEENKAAVNTCMVRTSLAYVQAFRVPKKIEKVSVAHSCIEKGKNIRYWEINIYPLTNDHGKIDFLLYIAKEVTD